MCGSYLGSFSKFSSTPSFMSLSSQSSALAEPQTLTVKLYWAVDHLSPVDLESHHMNSRCLEYLSFFSRSLSCAQSSDQSAPGYHSGCSEIPSLESMGLVNSRKAHSLSLKLKATPSGLT